MANDRVTGGEPKPHPPLDGAFLLHLLQNPSPSKPSPFLPHEILHRDPAVAAVGPIHRPSVPVGFHRAPPPGFRHPNPRPGNAAAESGYGHPNSRPRAQSGYGHPRMGVESGYGNARKGVESGYGHERSGQGQGQRGGRGFFGRGDIGGSHVREVSNGHYRRVGEAERGMSFTDVRREMVVEKRGDLLVERFEEALVINDDDSEGSVVANSSSSRGKVKCYALPIVW